MIKKVYNVIVECFSSIVTGFTIGELVVRDIVTLLFDETLASLSTVFICIMILISSVFTLYRNKNKNKNSFYEYNNNINNR